MAMTLQLTAQEQDALRERAAAEGVSMEDLARRVPGAVSFTRRYANTGPEPRGSTIRWSATSSSVTKRSAASRPGAHHHESSRPRG